MVTKGALSHVLDACATVETAAGASADLDRRTPHIYKHFEELSHQGFRILGVASREAGTASRISKDDEAGMTFLGFLVFSDPLKAGIVDTVSRLRHLGVALKIITGDNRLVAATLSQQVDFAHPRLLTGAELRVMSDEALLHQVNEVDWASPPCCSPHTRCAGRRRG